ncbi:pyridine nucleotide-disulfide oxidoreductase dimerization subunit [Enterobacter asburiae]|uniref:TVP38/TMEM64 family membrane protein n=1 Tax=Enterobacter asburiae TaxID=61645 RepID=A0A376F7A1_ENTAS|nr:pyridine nucleotide-disulfide oxidoreductase dimerization subunit [Enterobacter asburiae]
MLTTRPLRSALIFFALYVVVSALSIPGAAILTLLGGALFPLWEGTVLVSFASTLGATLAMLASRYLLREWVQRRFAQQMKTVNAGMAHDGAGYLFALRLMPLFPFFLVNLLMGLTRIGVYHYWWVSPGRHAARDVCLSECRARAGESGVAARYFVAGHANRLYTTGVIAAGHAPAVFPLSPVC